MTSWNENAFRMIDHLRGISNVVEEPITYVLPFREELFIGSLQYY